MDDRTRLKIVTLVLLGTITVVGIIALTIVAVFTDRELANAGRLVFAAVVLMALLGGLTVYVDHVRLARGEDDRPE